MGRAGRLAVLGLLMGIAGCASQPAGAPGRQSAAPPEVTAAFRKCYKSAYVPWLVDLMTAKKDPGTPVEVGLDRLVQGGTEERSRVRGFVLARRDGQYPDTNAMAAQAFNVCMAGAGDLDYQGDRLRGCFAEQEVIFDAVEMRYYRKRPLDEATRLLLERHLAGEGVRGEAVRRLTRDVYQVTSTMADGSATTEAEFQLCMNRVGYIPPL